jgi:ABC-type multidrug transport system ATPase subunit
MQDAIRVENLFKRYKDVVAVNNINFAIKKVIVLAFPAPRVLAKILP